MPQSPHTHANADYDVLIVGGGMVGASLAAALMSTSLRVAVLEAKPFGVVDQPSYDDRSIALSYGSRRILEGMDLWDRLREAVAPIRHIHVSERGRFGVTRIDHDEEGVPALGYVVENRSVGRVLYDCLDETGAMTQIAPARILALRPDVDRMHVSVEGERVPASLTARLIVAADGTRSTMRGLLGIGADVHDYGQSALIANVTPERDHGFTAYERFTDQGPIALLPMTPDAEGMPRCSLVWTHRKEDVPARMALDDEAFLAALGERFGGRLGRFLKVGARAGYPLALMQAQADTGPRSVLIGNAAHTLHPVAGQGFNLALRDVAVLAELLADAAAADGDPGAPDLLERYSEARRGDLSRVARYTDTLARLFTQPWAPLAHARGAGLVALDLLPPLRHWLARQSMGLGESRPRLARGLPLTEAGR